MRGWFGGALAAVCLVSACAPPHPVRVDVSAVQPADFEDGVPAHCQIKLVVDNNTENHVNRLEFRVGEQEFAVDDLNANTRAEFTRTADASGSCVGLTEALAKAKPSVFTCQMPNQTEGACQGMIGVVTSLTAASGKQVAQQELEAAKAASAPLTALLATPQVEHTAVGLLNALVWADAQTWYSNKYDAWSMKNVSLENTLPDGAHVYRGEYTYNNGQAGWVKVTLPAKPFAFPCMEFWDFSGSCRNLKLTGDALPALPPKPEAAPAADVATPDAGSTSNSTGAPGA